MIRDIVGENVMDDNPQFNLFASEQARDNALDQVARANPDFMLYGIDTIAKLENGREINGENIRRLLTEKNITPKTDKGWGALIRDAIRRRLLIPTGKRNRMTDIKSHGRITDIYRVRRPY